MKLHSPLILSALALSLAACGGAPEEAADVSSAEASVIEQRQDNFEAIGDAFKAIRGQLEDGAPDFAAIAGDAETIHTNAGKIQDYFPEGTGIDSGADTEALATIWEDPEGFAGAAEDLIAASQTLVDAAGTEDLAAVQQAVDGLGGSCKACHDDFRLDKD